MKSLALFILLLLLTAIPSAYAEQANLPPGKPSRMDNMPEYLSTAVVPLTKKEKRALQLSETWGKKDIAPVLSAGGKIVYIHGAVLPSIIGSPMQICDVELQAGEKIKDIVVGDSARWLVESGTSGSGSQATEHLYIKPVDAGLESTAIVTTDRRTYHLRLISKTKGFTPYVGFQYADQLRQAHLTKQAQQEHEQRWNSTDIDGDNVDLAELNFNYDVTGDRTTWRPERVYDDGRQMFIRLPSKAKNGEIPILLVRKSGQDILVNYRTKGTTLIVDGIFDRVALIIGVGSKQQKVEVRRKS